MSAVRPTDTELDLLPGSIVKLVAVREALQEREVLSRDTGHFNVNSQGTRALRLAEERVQEALLWLGIAAEQGAL